MTRCANAALSSPFANRPFYSGKSAIMRLLALVLLAFGLGACESKIASHGHTIDEVELAQVLPGTSTRVDVLANLGQPSFEGAFGSPKIYYVSQVMVEPPGGKKATDSRTIFVITFDKNDVVSEIDLLDETTGNIVAHLDATTPTPGDTYGFVDQAFSNLKRRRNAE
ncbi:outer membrane protein assembly factor BamE [Alphaproteobacteria bacterium]|nr:outer membrane protein assembly factor BamE [Alphaproteobacteria bacterium]